MNIFNVNTSLKSYAYPIIKIMICVALVLFLINRGHFYSIERISLRIIEGIFCVCLGLASILCIYISAAEMIIVHDNRTQTENVSDKEIEKCKVYSIDEVVIMAEKNDIIEIQIIEDGRCLNVGSSSDCKAGSSKFFDKMFYIGKEEFKNIEDFKKSLTACSTNGELSVIKIDGIKPK